MPRKFWTAEEREILRRRYPHESTRRLAADLKRTPTMVYGKAAELGLRKTAEYLASPEACRLRREGDMHPGKDFQFKPGHVPANKGLRRPGYAPGRMREGQFKKGERRGRAAEVYQPIGTERISRDGYLERKINEERPFQKRWRAVHLLEWEETHGPVPPGHAVAFKNGDKTDIRLDNLELITRAELMRRNIVHNLPPELKTVIQLSGALKRVIRRKARTTNGEEPPAGSTGSSL